MNSNPHVTKYATSEWRILDDPDRKPGVLKVNAGCGPHIAGDGWINTDLHRDEANGITPDVLASLDEMPFDDGDVARLYAGHCVEHVPLTSFDATMREIARILNPDDGLACFVCPDVYRAINWYRDGKADFDLVDACLEGPDAGIDPASAWDGCFHAWNCHEARLLAHVQRTFPDAIAVPMESSFLAQFPVVSRIGWQCCVMTRQP